MEKLYRTLIIVLAFIAGNNDCISQEILSLEQCIDLAIENNPQVKSQELQEISTHYNLKTAENNRLPSLNATLSPNAVWGRGINPATNTYVSQQFNTYNGNVNGNLVLFNGGYHLNNIKLQKNELNKNKSQVEKIKNDITIDVMTKYTNVLYLKECMELASDQVTISEDNLKNAQLRIDMGALAKVEIYKFQSQVDNDKLNLINFKNQLEQNIYELKLLIGKQNEDIDFVDNSLNESVEIMINKEDYLSEALENYPSLKFQKHNIASSEYNIKMAKSGFYPSVNLGANLGSTYSTINKFNNFEEQVKNNLSYGLGMNINVPIFSQMQNKTKVNSAKNNYEIAKNQYELEKQNVLRILNKAYIDFSSSMERYNLTKSSINTNEMSYNNEKIKFDLGRSSSLELINAMTNLNSISISQVQNKYQAIFNYLVLNLYKNND